MRSDQREASAGQLAQPPADELEHRVELRLLDERADDLVQRLELP